MSLKLIRKLAGIEEGQHTPTPLARCVAKVGGKEGTAEGDASRAHAICTASLQKAGVLKKGTKSLTKKGVKRSKSMDKAPDADRAFSDYENLLAKARAKREATENSYEHMMFLAGVKSAEAEVTSALVAEDVQEAMGVRFASLSGIQKLEGKTEKEKKEKPEPEEMPAPGSWKKLLTEKPFEADKSLRYDADAGKDKAMQALATALSGIDLPTSDGEGRKVAPDEFIYKGSHGENGESKFLHFKHKDSRNHVHLDVGTQTLIVPSVDKSFHRGTFDKLEHADVYAQFRSIIGME